MTQHTYRAALTLRSRNSKTGPIPVSTTSRDTCPIACPFAKDVQDGGGCYADGGPLAIYWAQVSSGAAGVTWDVFCDQVAALPAATLWRHDQAGDLPSRNRVTIDTDALARLVRANAKRRKRGFTYTHYNVTNILANRDAVAAANAKGFTINLSGNTLSHADALADTQCGPVVAVLPVALERGNKKGEWTETLADYRDRTRALHTPAGRRVVICPATYRDDVTCATCGLCAIATRKTIVGFPAHGASKRKAGAVAQRAA